MKPEAPRIIRYFVISAGLLLLLTALAKIGSSLGKAPILEKPDPILPFSFRHVFQIVGTIELVIAAHCLFSKNVLRSTGLVAWLSTSFVLYRLTLVWVDYQRPCNCLGSLTDALHIPPAVAETLMKLVLNYLLIGSYASLLLIWNGRRKTPSSPAAIDPPLSTT